MASFPTSVFRAYDIRGIRDREINRNFAYALGRALVSVFQSKQIVIGHDARPSSKEYSPYLIEGMTDQGADVIDLDQVPTELVPITAGLENIKEAVIITASHNPAEYVGFKLLTDYGSGTISPQNGRDKIQSLMANIEDLGKAATPGKEIPHDPWPGYKEHLFSLIPRSTFTKPMKLLAEAGNGLGGEIVTNLLNETKIEVTPLLFEPDGSYPHHIPNPMLPEARKLAESRVKEARYDLSIIFDGDADRGAFLDETGQFIPADYFDTLIMDHFIHPRFPDSPVVIDFRRGMVTEWAAKKNGYRVIRSKAGYPNLKQAMRDSNAQFGFEASAHTMWQHTFFAESSGLTLLVILSLLTETNQSFSALLAPYRQAVVMEEELNFTILQANEAMKKLAEKYNPEEITYPDGMVIRSAEWRASVRKSNTEPLVRLCLEATNNSLLEEKRSEITQLLQQFEAGVSRS
jgi:phosphomannomutase